MYVISKFIEGISLNPREFVLDAPEGNIMKFASRRAALEFLDMDEDDLEDSGIMIDNEQELQELNYTV